MDFPELLTEVQARSGVTDVVSRGEHFVRTAERALEKRLRVGAMESTATLATDADGWATLPADYLALITDQSALVRGGRVLSGVKDGTIDVEYYARIPSIIAAPNWLSEAEPELYIQAVLFQVFVANGLVEQATATLALIEGLASAVERADVMARYGARHIALSGPQP